MPTQHELLENISKGQLDNALRQAEIDKQQKKTAKDLANLACNFSEYINKQDERNIQNDKQITKVLGYLENNKDTGQEGVVKQLITLTTKVVGIEKKILVFSVAAAGLVYGIKFIGTIIIKTIT